jgi:hypothetical protein
VPDLTLIMSDNDNDEQDTDLAPTMQAPEQVHAWSDETDESDTLRQPWRTVWANAVIILMCGAVLASVVGIALWVSKPDKPQSNPTTTAAAPSAPVAAPTAPPVTTTVTTQPVTVTAQTTAPPTQVTTTMPPLVFTAAQDQRLLNDLSSMGYAIPNPALVVHEAHQYCLLVRQGEDSSQVNQDIQAATGWDASYTLQVTSGAILAYPNCRGYPLAP